MTAPAKTAVVRTTAAALLVAATALSGLPSSTAHAAGQYQVRMSGSAFSPRSLTVPAGATVTWTNQDTAPHDVKTSSGPHSFHSAMLDKGDTWSHTFTTAGNYSYLCTVHPGMTGQVTVKAAATTRPAATPSHTHEGGAEHDRAQSPATPAATPSGSTRAPSPSNTSPAPADSASAPAEQQAAPQTQPAASTRPLQPLLLLTGATAGAAVLCLLLVGSRAAAARRTKTEGDGDV